MFSLALIALGFLLVGAYAISKRERRFDEDIVELDAELETLKHPGGP